MCEFSSPRAGSDGGDCCNKSCVDNDFVCVENGALDCHNPDYEPYQDYTATRDTSLGIDKLLGDGQCNSETTIAAVRFDNSELSPSQG